MEIASSRTSVESLHSLVVSKANIPPEQQTRYSLFLDDGEGVEDEPARGLLPPEEVIADIMAASGLECLTLRLGICPLWLQVLISDDSMLSRTSPSSYRVQVLFNQSILETIEAVCKATGHTSIDHQLNTNRKLPLECLHLLTVAIVGEKLADTKTLEALGYVEGSEVFLSLRTPDVDGQ